jgi:helix-turn-helix protein
LALNTDHAAAPTSGQPQIKYADQPRKTISASTRRATVPTGDTYLSNRDLADRYGVDIRTVRHWRLAGTGPRGIRFGRHVRYALTEVERWEREQYREQYQVAG